MNIFVWCSLSFSVLIRCRSENHEYSDIILSNHLRMFESFRHPLYEYRDSWEKARTYILDQFQSFGLQIYKQNFRTQITSHDNFVTEVNGINIIGESKSVDERSSVILLGSHYDNSLTENPLHENGASLAILLETARLFQEARQNGIFHQNTTVLFVTFDIDSRNYIPSGPGKPGSYFFVQELMMNYLNGREFLGAIIIDTVSKFNWQNNSQALFKGMKEVFPDAVQVVINSGYKANFLAVFSRPDRANHKEVEFLIRTNEEINDEKSLRMERFILKDGVPIPFDLMAKIQRMQVVDFWSNPKSLPALLITDLGKFRRDFNDENCSDHCSAVDFLKNGRKQILQKLTMTLLQTAIYHQHILNGDGIQDSNISFEVTSTASMKNLNYDLILILALYMIYF